ncbi:DUF2169 family type VI secretion system accessory protein [Polyangium jinanense]|uniref:DUF2169 domain-containing protein n=1 Tax=Polyangium jinanense TaxID=2829994 RepID=A0A9X4AV31_9BACT|nr:DUF2169 domain-containing protein [Polyangium jinanense]MDC3962778.1 DUF2169 domain-containing protein [Polyangium jinanense]MDC3983887.1 DUF2169 domain-containing protein [Polyangium jinanense]
MDIVSYCPLRVAARPFVTADRRHALLVVCKATYLLTPGTSVLHESQEDVNEEDNFWDDDPRLSVYSPCDLVPHKRGADVVLVGHAFAPNDVPVRSILTRLCVGELDKAIEVFADRHVTPSGELREGPRVTRVRLRYERAAGGPGTTNPVGMRHDQRDTFGAIKLPNLQPPGRHVTGPSDLVEPIGYGPIAASWPSREARLGHLAGRFSLARWHEAPLPEGLDPLFFNVAPHDQEIPEIRPDERIVLEGLHHEHARLVTNLPGLRPEVVMERAPGLREEITLTADTLWFDTTRGICTLVWRGRAALVHPAEAGRVMVTMVGPGWASTRAALVFQGLHDIAIAPDDPDGSVTSAASVPSRPHPIMPFTTNAVHAPPPRESGVFPMDPDFDDEVTFVGLDTPAADPLPFARPRTQAPPAPPAAPSPLPFAPPPPAPVPFQARDLPFFSPLAPPPVPPSPHGGGLRSAHEVGLPLPPTPPAPAQVRPPSRHDLPFVAPPLPPAPPVVPPAPPTPPPIVPRLGIAPLGTPPLVAPAPVPPAPVPPPVDLDEPEPETVDAPAMIGPLATAEMAARVAPPLPPPPEPLPPDSPAPEAAKAPAAPALPLDDYPIERCAKITASIARRRDERAEILEAEELDLARYTDLERHWAEAIRAESERGKTRLLRAFDAAYVARLEEERGPITPAEYARLVVASERGHAERTLAELGLPRASMLRIEREMLARTAADPALGERIRHAIGAERAD